MKNNKTLLNIANKAFFLNERINNWNPNANEQALGDINEFVSLWQKSLKGENQSYFEKRLSLLGLEKDDLTHLLNYKPYTTKENCPKWINSFNNLLSSTATKYTASMEGAHGKLSTWLTNTLSSHNANGLT